MPGAIIGGILGFALSSTAIGVGIAGFLGVGVGTLWLIGASLGSLFDAPSLDISGSTPNYAFGQLANTKSQLLPVPIVYGRCRVGGNIFMQTFYDDSMQKMDMFVGVSEGPVNSIRSIYADDVELTNANGAIVHTLDDVTLNVHLGTPSQVVDSRDPTGNTYPHTAYVALTLKAQEKLSGNPVISSIVEGVKIWTPSGVKFSRNPAWIVYDFLTNTRYGVGIPTDLIDLVSFVNVANYCDEQVDGEPRFTLDYIIDTQRPAIDHLQAMLACFRGYFLTRDKIALHIEKSSTIYKVLGPDNFVKNTFSWWQKSNNNSPNRITLEWIDPDNHYEQSSAVFELEEDIQARGVVEKSFSMLGVTRSAQVGRLGYYLIETARRVQHFCSFQVGLRDADIEAGEVIALTYPEFTGWDEKPFRVLAVQDEGSAGVVTITCAEYSDAIYTDDGLSVDTPSIEAPPVTTDDIYDLQLTDIGYSNADGTWVPIIRATWQNPSEYTPQSITVRYKYDTANEWTTHSTNTRLTTQVDISGLKTNQTIDVWVNCSRPSIVETAGDYASINVGEDTIPPGHPTGLTATGWFGSIELSWMLASDTDYSHTEIWENVVDDINTAVKIAETRGNAYTRYVGSFQGRYYWVRSVDFTGNISAWNKEEGTYGNSDQETHQDFVDLLLEENPYLQEAINDLNTGIDTVDGKVDTVIDIDLPDYEQRLADRIAEVNDDIMDEVNRYADGTIDAMLDASEAISAVRDAGIITDPLTGTTSIFALDAYKTANDLRVSNVEIDLDAVESTLTSKVTLAQVDERIAGAVFGDAGELLLSGVDARVSIVEETLDGVEAELLEKATYVEVNELGGRIGTAETRLDGMDAEIDLLATSQELDAVESRVTIAEINIDALEGSITQSVVASVNITQDEEEILAHGLVDAMLNDQENKESADARSRASLAIAQTKLYAHIDDGLNAEAGQRTLLAAQVAGNTGAIQTESVARANADSAMASQITTLISNVGDNTAAIQTEATARADGDSAVASQVTTLQTTTVGGTVTESASAPSSPTAGQVYYNTTSKKYFRWSGSAWLEVKGVEGHSRSAIQIINESVDGIKGKHAVKIDTNGYVTGYELIGTGESSSMVFHVDNFLVGKPGTTNKYPFVIGTVDGVSRVSMDSAFIQDAAIKAAKIKNLEVDRIKLKNGGEISAINSTYATSQLSKNTGIHDLLSVAVQHDANATARTIVIASVSVQNHLAQGQAWITQNGVDKACFLDTGWADEGDIWSHTFAWTDTTNTGALCTYGLRVKVINGGECTIRPRSLSVIHIYK